MPKLFQTYAFAMSQSLWHCHWHLNKGGMWAVGGSVDLLQQRLPSHCINVFLPLVDITRDNGPTELRPASHYVTCNLPPHALGRTMSIQFVGSPKKGATGTHSFMLRRPSISIEHVTKRSVFSCSRHRRKLSFRPLDHPNNGCRMIYITMWLFENNHIAIATVIVKFR